MIPKLHRKGTSFRGAAQYILHDKGAETSERVAWTQTLNLATNNPEAAWRVMAATAMDQSRLKEEAGIPRTGRKSAAHVLHLTLAWHESEAEGLTREEMMRAVQEALRALGAEGHQALVVCHTDEPHPHVHILLCRVSMDDGRHLSSSKEKLKLSRWAQKYEEERRELVGKIFCEDRVLHNAARDRGTFVRGKKDIPRHIFEQLSPMRGFEGASELYHRQKAKDQTLGRRERALAQSHKQRWVELQDKHKAGTAWLHEEARRLTTVAHQDVGHAYLDAWADIEARQELEREVFTNREGRLLGKARNILQSVDWKGLLRNDRRKTSIREAFGLLGGSGARNNALRRRQQSEVMLLEQEEEARKQAATENLRSQLASRLAKHRSTFLIKRKALEWEQLQQRQAIATEWTMRRKERKKAWEHFRASQPKRQPLTKAEEFMGRMRKARLERQKASARDLDVSGQYRRAARKKDSGWER